MEAREQLWCSKKQATGAATLGTPLHQNAVCITKLLTSVALKNFIKHKFLDSTKDVHTHSSDPLINYHCFLINVVLVKEQIKLFPYCLGKCWMYSTNCYFAMHKQSYCSIQRFNEDSGLLYEESSALIKELSISFNPWSSFHLTKYMYK